MRAVSILLSMSGLCGCLSGCITMKSDHDALVGRVDELQEQAVNQSEELQKELQAAREELARVEAELERANRILGSAKATDGVRLDGLETEMAEVRGVAEDSQNEMAALTQNIAEMRSELELRLQELEAKTDSVTNIPEGKSGLWAEAQKFFDRKAYKDARRLFRIYLSRYPGDSKNAEARFQIGLTLFNERDNRSALGEFYWIVQNAPKSAVIHDALYYSGLAFARLGQCSKAIAYFKALMERGSKAPERYKKQAKKQIATLKKDAGRICVDEADGKAELKVQPGKKKRKK